MAAWPSTLPAPQLAGYHVKRQPANIRTDMETGPARQRRRYTAVPKRINVTWRLTAAQKVTFDSFWVTDLFDGNGWFTVAMAFSNAMTTVNARFVGEPDETALAGFNWDVAAVLEIQAS